MLWISRVPATLKMAKELLNKELIMEEGSDTRYSFYEQCMVKEVVLTMLTC